MKQKFLLIALLSLFTTITSYADEPLAIKGKPILTIFTNYKAGLGSQNELSGFNIDRAFIGYGVTLPKGFSAKGIVNTTTKRVDDKMEYDVYLKNIQVDWSNDKFFASMGLINLMQFSEQERIWGHRYIFKSFQEEYGFTFCEDVGILAGYHFADWISMDVAFTNGEGRLFKNTNNDFRYGVGLSIKPTRGLLLRAYFDSYDDMIGIDGETKDQMSYALFVGYEHKRFTVGAEYNSSYNYQFAKGKDMRGYSLYATVPIRKGVSVYGRFDMLKSSNNWESERAGNMIIAGFDYQPIKQIRISPNFQSWKGVNSQRENYLLLSLELKI